MTMLVCKDGCQKNIVRSILKNVSCCTDEEKILLGLPNVTNTIQKVQGSPIVFTTIEKDKKKYFINPLYIFISLTMTCHYCIG